MRIRSTGLTSIDVLAAVMIAGMVLIVAVPSVLGARDAARQQECSNHLKNLALGFQNHRDVFKIWPTAGHDRHHHASYKKELRPHVGPRQNAGWGFQVVPYLEGDSSYAGGGQYLGAGEDVNALVERSTNVASAVMPAFYCPSRRKPSTNKSPRGFPSDGAAMIWDPWQGKHVEVQAKPVTKGLGQTDYAAPIGRHRNGGSHDGVVIRSHRNNPRLPRESVSSIPDGESNTFILADKRLRLAQIGSDQVDDNEGFAVGWDHDIVRDTAYFRPPMPDPGEQSKYADDGCGTRADARDVAWTDIDGNPRGPERTCAKVAFGDWRFGSSHSAGFNMAMADGSVHFINYEINMGVFQDLGNRRDQNPIPQDLLDYERRGPREKKKSS